MIDGYDYITGSIFLIIIYLLMYNVRRKMTTKETSSYFFTALHLKMLGAIMLGLIYKYYYGGGDTLLYHELGTYVYQTFWKDTSAWFELVFMPIQKTPSYQLMEYAGWNMFYMKQDASSYFMIRIIGLFSIFCGCSYFAIAQLCGLVSFFGSWAMFVTFITMYPKMIKRFAIAVFYFPSVFFWGSGLMKDSICFGCLGLFFYAFYFAVLKRKNIASNVILGISAVFVLYIVKIYILLAFIPMLAIWTYLTYLDNIRSAFFKVFLAPMLFLLAGVGGIFAVLRISAGTAYSVDNLASKTKITSSYLQSMSKQGSVYYLSEFDGSLGSLARIFPEAVVVALYRPGLWEARNPFAFLSALEATYFLLFTFYVIFIRVKLKNVIATFFREPIAPACLFFSVFFSFSVGMTSGNFGTLVRYKIPMIPFYIGALMIMLESNRKKSVAELSADLLELRKKQINQVDQEQAKLQEIGEEQEENEDENEENPSAIPKFKIKT
jgi:hypothetical protein